MDGRLEIGKKLITPIFKSGSSINENLVVNLTFVDKMPPSVGMASSTPLVKHFVMFVRSSPDVGINFQKFSYNPLNNLFTFV